jgi:hypothetical protein
MHARMGRRIVRRRMGLSLTLTLDDAATMSLAGSDPVGFIQNLGGAVVLDEIQKAPELFPAISSMSDPEQRHHKRKMDAGRRVSDFNPGFRPLPAQPPGIPFLFDPRVRPCYRAVARWLLKPN